MYRKSDNITIMSGIETNVINELFNSFCRRYQERLQTKMKGSSFTFERTDFLEYHLHEISLNRGSSYINSPEWIKNKKVIINPKNTEDNNCFRYAIIAALTIRILTIIRKEFLNLGNLLIITIGIIFVFQQGIKTILCSRKAIAILQ